MATGVSTMRRSPHAGRFGRRSEEFVAKDHVEVEWQFEVTDLDLAESWLKKHSPTSDLAAIPDSTKELLDAYYDTEDWPSYRAGYSLRVRRDGESAEATMKVLTPAEGAIRQRREISEPLKGNAKTPKVTRGPVGERVRRLAGARDLRSSSRSVPGAGSSNSSPSERMGTSPLARSRSTNRRSSGKRRFP
jgi:hypothetical protein